MVRFLCALGWGQWWRTLLGPALLNWRVSEKVLRKERFSGRENSFLLALLEMRRRVFWLDSPLKASFTSCRSASCYVPCYCGPQKRVLDVKSRTLGWLLVITPWSQELTVLSHCPAVLAHGASASSWECLHWHCDVGGKDMECTRLQPPPLWGGAEVSAADPLARGIREAAAWIIRGCSKRSACSTRPGGYGKDLREEVLWRDLLGRSVLFPWKTQFPWLFLSLFNFMFAFPSLLVEWIDTW